ncbi:MULTISPECIES: bifunctional phosphoribosylaminoimidazolecarboxamide formyltransferase/IMP cyclohydrolase [unclassified Rhodococcus (in: high G+C Gram-positive bacteria)]|uniref:bifunctional phosphoribosylaminoimidazolecarboxamide formyltransferase/IMP cyclohydrolase n=1 Tax=unclassified Rhodococcus (in: high G+C Gram-positive bacteria) TaxID=192944 RepID=UPI001639FB58|nr:MULTISPECIES: bifunctional phosphoribosylaminoimidazolecarboxamide formyltransferase/IMP cyclohydrolase [unclassified Rhodococcus (in: high G+C Gram-positive bacteria)]MBC2642843.1 bifunctional phosphoribosylaminoimidazolecarboxamide formyltransferase/IMP cyclohydrolase [Rhodococcus sp. 3A]MBC2892415.1 bifunctional phosphoribosylaminoimidazolecarboxamide formyltransferase/IMP cyclohydrolase [Rhodococcus sp. 4CII]
MSERKAVRRALVSVYDKTGLVELATGLHKAGVELVSTGSTAAKIADAGIPVTPVEALTGFPECLEGRVKTLHPRVHAGVLADTRKPEHLAQLEELGIEAFQLVIVNLYPFTQTVASGATPDECVEQIDIGGPSMVRAAAKNHPSVAVVVDPARYDDVLTAVTGGGFTLPERTALAAQAFQHTASYDVAVASWMTSALVESGDSQFPEWVGATWDRSAVLRYGENPHQAAALYVNPAAPAGLAQAQQLHGKEMSYNNYTDGDAAWRAAFDFSEPAVAIIKHANPCGIAVGSDIAEAHRKAHACDPVSAYGGVIAANREVTVEMAEQVAEIFTEVIIAPSYADGALGVLQRKKNVRVLLAEAPTATGIELRPVSGGALLQERDVLDAEGDDPANWTLAVGDAADEQTLKDLEFAWRACRSVKSNAILLASDGASVGVGMGQVNRVDSAHLAVQRAGDRVVGSVGASDAFFPFPDGLQVLANAGVKAVVQPGGSVRDNEVIDAAKEAGITMYLTGARHFAH